MLRTSLLALLSALVARPAGAYTPAEAKAPMTATLVRSDAEDCGADCPEWLALTGRIGFETPGVLRAALARIGPRRVPVLLDSPGGESRAALQMARMIRARGLDTAVAATVLTPCDATDRPCQARLREGRHPGHVGPGTVVLPACASACAFVLAGGVARVVPPGAYVGVHQAKQVLTFHPVVNTFRTLSRIVNGRKVEVARTLIATRALPVRVETRAAPQSLYSELDRALVGLGVDESILPLIRATPPSGIHWMTPAELASTRLATDAAEARTLVEREAASQAAAARRGAALPAALTLEDAQRWTGTVLWRVDAAAPSAPALVGDWEVPERHLRGSVRIAADAARDPVRAFAVVTRFATQAVPDAAQVLSEEAPDLCDLGRCVEVISGDTAFDRPSSAAFDVPVGWRALFLEDLHRLAWLRLNIRTEDNNGRVALSLAGPGAGAVADWERLCCGFDADQPAPRPATPLPAYPDHPGPSLVKGIGAVRPAWGRPPSAPWVMDAPALYDDAPMDRHGFPAAARGSIAWFPLATLATAGAPGAAVLLGAAELPKAGLRVSVEAGASRPDVLGRLTVRLHILTGDPSRFGPMRRAFAINAWDARSRATLFVDGIGATADGAENEIHIDIPESGPVAGAFQVGFEDARGRRVTLALPFDPAVAALLQAAARGGRAGGS